VADRGYPYEYSLQTMREIPYGKWRGYDPEDAVRFYALRLREEGMIKSSPNKILADGTDGRLWNESQARAEGLNTRCLLRCMSQVMAQHGSGLLPLKKLPRMLATYGPGRRSMPTRS
jgi:hypothetical protein